MKNYRVNIFTVVNGTAYNNRIKHFYRLTDALEYAAGREERGELWEVVDLRSGEAWRLSQL